MKAKTKELADSVGAVYPVLFMGRHDGVLFTETELETFVDLAVAAEREACANLCEDTNQEYEPFTGQPRNLSYTCAAAIRARGTT